MKNDLKIQKDKAIGKITEAFGKFADDEETEFKGKAKTIKADIAEKFEDIKDDNLRKANHFIDKIKQDKSDN